TAGSRYTNDGIVWKKSRIGRRAAENHRLRAARIPRTIPTTSDARIATSTLASVTIESSQRPSAAIARSDAPVMIAGRSPDTIQASPTPVTVTSHHGLEVRTPWKGLSSPTVKTVRMASVSVERFVLIQSTASLTPAAREIPIAVGKDGSIWRLIATVTI